MFQNIQDFVRNTPGLNIVSQAMRVLGAALKPFMPNTLNGRFIFIVVAPVIIIQIISTWLYMERYSRNVTLRLASTVAGDIALLVAQTREQKNDSDRRALFAKVLEHKDLVVTVRPGQVIPDEQPKVFFSFISDIVSEQLETNINQPVWFDLEKRPSIVEVQVQLDGAVMYIETRRSRIIATNWHNFLVWMIVATALFLGIALLFLRNQVRAILRLGMAAENFGKGRDLPDFRPAGAREIRKASAAVIEMRDRINAHVLQRTEMLAGVSHDLRTPITRMKLQLAMLGDGRDIEDMKSDLADMEHMLEEYLNFARGQAGEDPVLTDISVVFDEVWASASARGHSIEIIAPETIKLPLRRTAFKRCITNLVNNACAFGTKVTVTAHRDDKKIIITVEDNGPGIPEARREEAFRPFHRLDEGRNLDEGGSGLGLAIARDVARRHGGDIKLETSQLGGLKAIVNLPG